MGGRVIARSPDWIVLDYNTASLSKLGKRDRSIIWIHRQAGIVSSSASVRFIG